MGDRKDSSQIETGVEGVSRDISPGSLDPTVACIRHSGLRVVTSIAPLSPVRKNLDLSIEGSSALSMIRSQGSSIFASHFFTSRGSS